MRRHDYPSVYPPLSSEDEKELKHRKVLLIDRHVAEEVLEPETCLAILEKISRSFTIISDSIYRT